MKLFFLLDAVLGMVFYPFLLKFKKNVVIKGKVRIKSFPYIDLRNNSKLFIEENVMINSSNYGYHINMHSRVKLFADGHRAEIHIGANTRIHGTCIHAQSKIKIGKNCLIAANCHILDVNGHSTSMRDPELRLSTKDKAREIIIEDNVWIAANCIILKGVTIGHGSIISAGSVVTGNIPPNVIAGGNPAQILKIKS